MSDYQTIATVTATISHILAGVKDDVDGTVITTKPPDVVGGQTPANMLNLFLYQVEHNIGYKNWDLPTRNTRGELFDIHRLALNLYYLLTAYASNYDDFLAHQILASGMKILHKNPVLTRDMIRATIQAETKISGSDLADQVELVKITLQPLSLEEITKLWSSFFQTNYRISVAYQATVVMKEGKKEPKPTLPVRERELRVLQIRQPVIERVEPQILERKPNAKLTIIGQNLKNDRTVVRFGEVVKEPESKDVTNYRIQVTVPDNLLAGIKTVQVVHRVMIGKPPTSHKLHESNLATFMLAPRITDIAPKTVSRGDELTLNFDPAITPEQNVFVLIGDLILPVSKRDPKSQPIKKLSIKIPADFPVDTFLLRLRVDGAESYLKKDDDPDSPTYGKFIEPKITVS